MDGGFQGRRLPPTLRVEGAAAPWLNTTYELKRVRDVVEPGFRQERSHRGDFVFIGNSTSPKSTKPYFWYDTKNQQWKIATVDFKDSHFLAVAVGQASPSDAGPWRPGPCRGDSDPFFPEDYRSGAKRIKVIGVAIAIGEDSSQADALGCSRPPLASNADVADGSTVTSQSSSCALDFPPALLDSTRLSRSDAEAFSSRGYLVKTAEELQTKELAGRALREVNLAMERLTRPETSDSQRGVNTNEWARDKHLRQDLRGVIALMLGGFATFFSQSGRSAAEDCVKRFNVIASVF